MSVIWDDDIEKALKEIYSLPHNQVLLKEQLRWTPNPVQQTTENKPA